MRYLTVILLMLGSLGNAQTLQDYQQEALENNPMLQAKYKEFEAAMQRVTQVKGLPDPTLSVSAFGRMTETRVGPQMARFTLSQMFPWFGTLKAQGEATALMADAAFERYIDEQNKLRFQVAKSYYPLVELEEVLSIQQENLGILQSWKTLATAKYENGKTTLADVLRIDLMIQDMETDILILEEMKTPLRVSFNQLLNRSDSMEVNISPLDSVNVPVYAEEQSWNEHPLLKELALKKQSKEKQYTAIEKQSLPKLGVGLDYIIVAERQDAAGMNVEGNGQDAFMPMVSVSLPIFRKKYKAAMKENRLQSESIELMAQATRNELSATYENVKFDIRREMEMLELYGRQVEETQRILNLLVTEFSNSGKDLVELLRIQMQLLNYQKLEAKSKTKLHTALANLDYILGGVQ